MKKRTKPKAKSSGKSTGRALIPQPHGGALQPGAGGGTQPGAGRPPSVIRERLRGTFSERIAIIEEIADGKPVQHAQLPLAAIIPHVICANCGESQIAAKEPKDLLLLTFDVQMSASPRDRLAAIDMTAKYGLGEKNEVTLVHPEVQERLARQAQIIASQPTWESNALMDRLSAEVWK